VDCLVRTDGDTCARCKSRKVACSLLSDGGLRSIKKRKVLAGKKAKKAVEGKKVAEPSKMKISEVKEVEGTVAASSVVQLDPTVLAEVMAMRGELERMRDCLGVVANATSSLAMVAREWWCRELGGSTADGMSEGGDFDRERSDEAVGEGSVDGEDVVGEKLVEGESVAIVDESVPGPSASSS
jgi:hypothetical protein